MKLILAITLSLLAATGIRFGLPTGSGHAISPSISNGLGSNCACQQLDSKVSVRGRTNMGEEGHLDFCSKAGTFNIANPGDFVACAANTPRVMNGVIYSEPDAGPAVRINYLLNASQFDNVDWLKTGVVSAAPSVVADQALAPDNTMTADLITFAATTSGVGLSVLNKSAGSGTAGHCPTKAHTSAQVYIKGVTLDGGTTSGTIDMGIYDGTAYQQVQCAYTGSIYTRCIKENVNSSGAANGDFYIGNGGLLNGVTRPTQSVYLALADCEEGNNVSSPIDATTSLANGQLWTRMPDQIENRYSFQRTAWLGDSLSANTVESNTSQQVYPRAPERYGINSNRNIDNWAVNGATFETDCKSEWSTWAARSYPQRLIFWCGINDIHVSLENGITLWTDVQAFLENTIPPGTTEVLLNLMPFGNYVGWTSGQDTQRIAYNNSMASYCDGGVINGAHTAQQAGHSVICIDIASRTQLAADHTKNDPVWTAPDGLHLNQDGGLFVGDLVFQGAP